MTTYKNILIIKLGALGDWIQMTGWYAAIRKKFPQAHITLMTMAPFVKLATKCPAFDSYIIDNRSHNPFKFWHIVKKVLADGGYDLIIDLQKQKRTRQRYYSFARFLTKNQFTWASMEPQHLYVRETPKKHRFTWGKENNFIISVQPELASLSFCKADPEVLKLLPEKYVLMIPGCSPAHPYKRWPATSYQELAQRLANDGINTVVLGTNAEKSEIETICQNNPKSINFCNKAALLDIPEIAQKSLAIVGNDTGPQHMAELSNQPTVTLFSQITQNSRIYRDNIVNLVEKEIKNISVEKVYQTLQSLWHKA